MVPFLSQFGMITRELVLKRQWLKDRFEQSKPPEPHQNNERRFSFAELQLGGRDRRATFLIKMENGDYLGILDTCLAEVLSMRKTALRVRVEGQMSLIGSHVGF